MLKVEYDKATLNRKLDEVTAELMKCHTTIKYWKAKRTGESETIKQERESTIAIINTIRNSIGENWGDDVVEGDLRVSVALDADDLSSAMLGAERDTLTDYLLSPEEGANHAD